MLARCLEQAGLSTVLVTNMPFWAERVGAPRTLAVEFPFGHTLGQPHNAQQQTRVVREALLVLTSAERPGTIVHSEERWPEPVDKATKDWQPKKPSPLLQEMAPQFVKIMREHRRRTAK